MSSNPNRRRHPGWLLLPLLLAGFPPPASPQDEGNLFNTPMDVRLGERYFQRQCSRCHGQDAKGNDETGAPDLTRVSARTGTETAIFNILRNGIAGTAMLPVTAETPDPTVWQTVSYVMSLRSDPANIQLPGSAAAGLALYQGKGACGSCHMINGNGGRMGPDLSLVGRRLSPDELRSALIDPNASVLPRWWTMRVTQVDGTVHEGLRMDEDSFSLRIIDAQEELWSFRKEQVAAVERIETSTMPSYAQTLTNSEVDDLVAYLFSLRDSN